MPGTSKSTTAAVPQGDGRNQRSIRSSGGDGQGDPPTHTRVAPLLLLNSVPEAVMCQLVLAGWEQSGSGGGATKGH